MKKISFSHICQADGLSPIKKIKRLIIMTNQNKE